MNKLRKFMLCNSKLIKGGGDPELLEEEFDIWKNTLSQSETMAIESMYNNSPNALQEYYNSIAGAK